MTLYKIIQKWLYEVKILVNRTEFLFPISDLAVIIVSAAAIAILLVCIIVVLICLRRFKWYVKTSEQL